MEQKFSCRPARELVLPHEKFRRKPPKYSSRDALGNLRGACDFVWRRADGVDAHALDNSSLHFAAPAVVPPFRPHGNYDGNNHAVFGAESGDEVAARSGVALAGVIGMEANTILMAVMIAVILFALVAIVAAALGAGGKNKA